MKELISAIGILLVTLLLVTTCNRDSTYRQYILIDDCVYLEENIGQVYGDNNTKVLIGCDQETRDKYKSRLNKKFDQPKGWL